MPYFRNLSAVVAVSATAFAATFLPASTGPAPALTGGFGEANCQVCHRDYPLNETPGAIQLDSLPAVYQPQQVYRMVVSVRHAELERGGFQLSARFEDGTQAGSFAVADTALLRVQRAAGVAYLSHTLAGTHQVKNHTASWSFDWTAPAAQKRVLFHVAANAANHDASEFGDRIFTATFHSGNDQIRK